jgi:hypothetical protein
VNRLLPAVALHHVHLASPPPGLSSSRTHRGRPTERRGGDGLGIVKG